MGSISAEYYQTQVGYTIKHCSRHQIVATRHTDRDFDILTTITCRLMQGGENIKLPDCLVTDPGKILLFVNIISNRTIDFF